MQSVICHDSFRPITSDKLPHVTDPVMSPAYNASVVYSTREGFKAVLICGRRTATPCSHKSEVASEYSEYERERWVYAAYYLPTSLAQITRRALAGIDRSQFHTEGTRLLHKKDAFVNMN